MYYDRGQITEFTIACSRTRIGMHGIKLGLFILEMVARKHFFLICNHQTETFNKTTLIFQLLALSENLTDQVVHFQ